MHLSQKLSRKGTHLPISSKSSDSVKYYRCLFRFFFFFFRFFVENEIFSTCWLAFCNREETVSPTKGESFHQWMSNRKRNHDCVKMESQCGLLGWERGKGGLLEEERAGHLETSIRTSSALGLGRRRGGVVLNLEL